MPPDSQATLSSVAVEVLRHPVRHLLRKWNYKSAVTSSLLRGLLFFAANVSSGWTSATAALATEFLFRFSTSGFYGALTQAFRRVEPARTGLIAAMIVLPLVAHTLEVIVHWWRGTANLGLSITLSVCFTALSTSFNLFAMRRGVLIVGDADCRSLCADLRAMPGLVVSFVAPLCRAVRPATLARTRPADLRP